MNGIGSLTIKCINDKYVILNNPRIRCLNNSLSPFNLIVTYALSGE